jgi:hypothetical protein
MMASGRRSVAAGVAMAMLHCGCRRSGRVAICRSASGSAASVAWGAGLRQQQRRRIGAGRFEPRPADRRGLHVGRQRRGQRGG